MARRALLRLAAAAAALSAAAAAPTSARAEFERCCFRVDVQATGQTQVADEKVTWDWRARHLARYVEHGRIFNAVTTVPGVGYRAVGQGAFAAAGADGCEAGGSSPGFARDPGAYTSLEDGPAGRTILVVRSGRLLRGLAGCAPTALAAAERLGGPSVYELPTPPGPSIRFAGAFSAEAARRSEAGFSAVRVRFTYVPRSELRRALADLAAETPVPPALDRAR